MPYGSTHAFPLARHAGERRARGYLRLLAQSDEPRPFLTRKLRTLRGKNRGRRSLAQFYVPRLNRNCVDLGCARHAAMLSDEFLNPALDLRATLRKSLTNL